jgi:hypothetical protein
MLVIQPERASQWKIFITFLVGNVKMVSDNLFHEVPIHQIRKHGTETFSFGILPSNGYVINLNICKTWL